MNDIEKLKELLFGNEKQALDAITRRLDTPESRAADVADVLPDALNRSYRDDPRLSKALERPLEQSLRESIRRNPQDIADALFPIIGPAIRKAIAESMKSLVQTINFSIDAALSPRRQIKWRFEALRAGVPLGEYVLQQTLVYRVEQVYLIHRHSGLLIAHVQHEMALVKDTDAVSGMFTAIQDFVSDSFAQDHTGRLETADVGNLTLWAVHAPDAMLACLIRGVPPRSLRVDLTAALERIQLRYAEALRDYEGDAQSVAGVEHELEECLRLERLSVPEEKKKRMSPGLFIVFGLLLAGLGFLVFKQVSQSRQLSAFTDALRNTPGVAVTGVTRDGARVVVRGLRDPLAATPEAIAREAGLDADALDIHMAPYVSLDPELSLRRAARVLDPPAGVELTLNGGTLHAGGEVTADWQRTAAVLGPAIPGVERIVFEPRVDPDVALLEAAKAALEPPDSVILTVEEAVLGARGVAPDAWLRGLGERASAVPGIRRVNLDGLESAEMRELQAQSASLDGRDLRFDWREQLADDADIDGLATDVKRFIALARRVGLRPEIIMTGHTDGTGGLELNEALQIMRAEVVRVELESRGVDPADLFVGAGRPAPEGTVDPALKKVVITVQAVDEHGVNRVGR